jgi:hypothetical protein
MTARERYRNWSGPLERCQSRSHCLLFRLFSFWGPSPVRCFDFSFVRTRYRFDRVKFSCRPGFLHLLSLPGTFFAGNCRIDMGVSRSSKGRFKYFTHFVHFHGCTLNSALKWPNESAFRELFQTVSDIAIELLRKVDGARPLAPNRE